MNFFSSLRDSLMKTFQDAGSNIQKNISGGLSHLVSPASAANQFPQNEPAPKEQFVSPLPSQPIQVQQQVQPQQDFSQIIQRGLERFSPGTPLATQSSQLAQAGQGLPDPLLPVLIALAETRGGLDLGQRNKGINNPFNIMSGGRLVDYPDLTTSILGGGPQDQLGLIGLLRPQGMYQGYRDNGNLSDFLNQYTPPGDVYGNPNMEQQLKNYEMLRSLFY